MEQLNIILAQKLKSETAVTTWQTSLHKSLTNLPVRTVQDVVKSENDALSYIWKEHGELKVKAILTILLTDVVDYFSVGKSMGADQIAQTINLILEEYYYFKPDDFVLCFKNAKKFKYGKMYDRIDGMVIFAWLEQYLIERQNYFIELERNRYETIDENRVATTDEPTKMREILGEDSNIRTLLESKIHGKEAI